VSRDRAALLAVVSLLAGAGLALLFASIGDGDEGQTVTVTATRQVTAARQATGPAEETLGVREVEYRLQPAAPRVRAARVIDVLVRNDGKGTHALVIDTPHGELRSRRLSPGDSTHLKVDLPAGRYRWYCPIDDHATKGMTGSVTVSSPPRVVRRTKTLKAPTTRERTVKTVTRPAKTVTAPPRTVTKTVTTTTPTETRP
jgi:uncharacterized cupredoxin-like copper-binding protein